MKALIGITLGFIFVALASGVYVVESEILVPPVATVILAISAVGTIICTLQLRKYEDLL